MPEYVIERDVAGVGDMTDEQARATVLKSLEVLDDLGDEIRWVRSFIVDNKIYCIYFAPSEELIREHARRVGAPVDRISEVRHMLDPTTERPGYGRGAGISASG
jgi:hypothetical protein